MRRRPTYMICLALARFRLPAVLSYASTIVAQAAALMSPFLAPDETAACALRMALASAGSITPHSGLRSGSLPSVVMGITGEVTAKRMLYMPAGTRSIARARLHPHASRRLPRYGTTLIGAATGERLTSRVTAPHRSSVGQRAAVTHASTSAGTGWYSPGSLRTLA